MASAATGTSLSELTNRQVRVASAPLATVSELVFEAMGHPLGTPASWIDAIRSALGPNDLALLGPLFGNTESGCFPECLVPPPDRHMPTFDDEVDRMVEVASDELVPELVRLGHTRAGPWGLVARHPDRWLGAYVGAVRRAWTAVAPLWQQAAPLLEREVERVGAGLARGGFPHLMDGLSPRGRVVDDRYHVLPTEPPAVIGEGLILQPMLVGPQARLVVEEAGAVVHLAYPLPGIRRLPCYTDPDRRGTGTLSGTTGSASGSGSGSETGGNGNGNGNGRRGARTGSGSPLDGTSLGALLGEPRADILRRIDHPVTAGRLAADMLFVPSAISHHLEALERARLVARERRGRHVLVHRTARGSALLHLYEP